MKNLVFKIISLALVLISLGMIPCWAQSGPPITNINGTVCVGDNAQFRVTTSCSITQWTASSGGVIQGANNMATVIVKWSSASSNAWVQVNYSNCTTSFLSFAVNAKTDPSTSISISPNTVCQPETVTLQAQTTNVNGSPNYSWYIDSQFITTTSTPTYNFSATNLTPGQHSAYVTISAMSCSNLTTVSSVPQSFTVSPNVSQVSAPSGSTTRCIGSGTSTYTAGASDATSYSWGLSPETAGTISAGGVVTWTSSFSGTATVTVTANGCNGSTSSASTSVTVTPGVSQVSNPSGTTIRCIGSGTDNYSATAPNATGYTWTLLPAAAGSIAPFTGTVTWSSTFSGAASVEVTATGCTIATTWASTNVTITPLVGQVSAPSGTITRCIGSGTDTYTANASNATSYTWSISPAEAGTISTIGVVTWGSTFSGTATISVTAYGCNSSTSSSSLSVTVTPGVGQVSAPSGSTTRCIGSGTSTYAATAPSAASYTWSISPATAGTISTGGVATWNSSFSGTATITVTANGCDGSASSASTSVTVTPGVSQVSNPSGTTIRCIGSGTDNYSATAANATGYTWRILPAAAGSIAPFTGTVSWNSTFSGAASVEVTASGCNGSTTTSSTNVTVTPLVGPVSAPAGATTRCFGSGTNTYTANASNAISYSWSLSPVAAGTISAGGEVTWNSTFSSSATVAVTASGCNGSTSSASTNVTVSPGVGQVSDPSGPTTRCVGSGTSTYTASAPNASSYSWSISPTTAGTISTAGVVTWNSSFSGTATVTVTANGCDGSTSTESITVFVGIGSVTIEGIASRCQGSGTDAFLGNAENASSYSYEISPPAAGTIATGAAGYVTWNASFMGTAIVTATATGCNGLTSSASKNVYTKQTVSPVTVPFGDLEICKGDDPTTYSASAVNVTGYIWEISPSDAGSIVNEGLEFGLSKCKVTWASNFSGIATITVTANGCGSTTASAQVDVKTPPAASLSPNGSLSSAPTTLTTPFVEGYKYQWYLNGSPISGEDESTYVVSRPGTYNVLISSGSCSDFAPIPATFAAANYNGFTDPSYIKERSALVDKKPDGQPLTEQDMATINIGYRQETISYFNGLGSVMQTVVTQGSMSRTDIVQPVIYDNYNREAVKYLPYTTGNDGAFKTVFSPKELSSYTTSPQYLFYQNTAKVAADAKPYAETIFEPSPLNRVIKQGATGEAWQPNNDPFSTGDKTIKIRNELNKANEVYRFNYDLATGVISIASLEADRYYALNQLSANKTYDEHNNEVIEYTDKLGRTICKKVQYKTETGGTKLYAATYYIYDDLGNLVVVLPPEASKDISSFMQN